MGVEMVSVSEKAVNDLLRDLAEVAADNGIGQGKEGMLVLLGMAAGQISAEIEIESGAASAAAVDHLMSAIRVGIYNSRRAAGRNGPGLLGTTVH